MGVFIKRNCYWIDYYVNGRRRREKVGTSKTLAEKALMKRRVLVAEGRFLDVKSEQRTRFKEFADIYVRDYAKSKRSFETTDVTYLKRFGLFFGDKHLHEITTQLVQRYQSIRRSQVNYKKKLPAPSYINRELACLKCMFNRAIDWGYAKENPVKKVKFAKENNERTRFLEKSELKTLLDCSDERLRPVILFAVNTGMRLGEIQGLKWGDVDFARGFITLRETKNGETRHVPMNCTVKDILLSFKTKTNDPESYIFCNKFGNLYNPRVPFKRALTKAKISNFRFHDLRHTAASYLAMAGIDLNTIRMILGHKSIRMVLRYAHLSDTHQAKAVAVLDEQMVTIRSPEQKNGKMLEIKESASSYGVIL